MSPLSLRKGGGPTNHNDWDWRLSKDVRTSNSVDEMDERLPLSRIVILPCVITGMNIAELAHMEDHEDQDQDTVKAKVTAGAGKAADKRASLDNPRKSLEKSVTLTRQASEANRWGSAPWTPRNGLSCLITFPSSFCLVLRNLTGTEAREEGNIGLNVLKVYFGAGGGWPVIVVLLVLFAIEQVWALEYDK